MNADNLGRQTATMHLSDDDLDEILIGETTPAFDAHLAECAACEARLAEFRTSLDGLGAFNQASLAWSEAKSNTMTRDLTAGRAQKPFAVTVGWAAAAALPVAFVIVLAIGSHRDAAPTPAQQAGAAQTFNREQEIASDNAMLAAIDSAIYRPVPSPVEAYGIDKDHSDKDRRNTIRQVKDE